MISNQQKEAVDNFDAAMRHRNGAGAVEYRLFIESCLAITNTLIKRILVQENTVATYDWKQLHQAELTEKLYTALHYLNRIEAGDYDKRTG